jgi:hypothetical protein
MDYGLWIISSVAMFDRNGQLLIAQVYAVMIRPPSFYIFAFDVVE